MTRQHAGGGLTPRDIETVIGLVLGLYEGDWAWRELRAAASEAEAVAWCRRFLLGGYHWPATDRGPAGSITMRPGGVEAEVNGCQLRLSWHHVVRHARAPRQLALL